MLDLKTQNPSKKLSWWPHKMVLTHYVPLLAADWPRSSIWAVILWKCAFLHGRRPVFDPNKNWIWGIAPQLPPQKHFLVGFTLNLDYTQLTTMFQDPFQKLPSEFQKKLSEEERKELKGFLAVTDVEAFTLELHEILLLKTNNAVPDEGYQPHWE